MNKERIRFEGGPEDGKTRTYHIQYVGQPIKPYSYHVPRIKGIYKPKIVDGYPSRNDAGELVYVFVEEG